jgi:hypothetical protein
MIAEKISDHTFFRFNVYAGVLCFMALRFIAFGNEESFLCLKMVILHLLGAACGCLALGFIAVAYLDKPLKFFHYFWGMIILLIFILNA